MVVEMGKLVGAAGPMRLTVRAPTKMVLPETERV
jgi:hypothetical protein